MKLTIKTGNIKKVYQNNQTMEKHRKHIEHENANIKSKDCAKFLRLKISNNKKHEYEQFTTKLGTSILRDSNAA